MYVDTFGFNEFLIHSSFPLLMTEDVSQHTSDAYHHRYQRCCLQCSHVATTIISIITTILYAILFTIVRLVCYKEFTMDL